jgi:hypothetical protein
MKISSLTFRKFISDTRRGDCVKNKDLGSNSDQCTFLSCFRTYPIFRPVFRISLLSAHRFFGGTDIIKNVVFYHTIA